MDLRPNLEITSSQMYTTFLLEARLGLGTFGDVWRARDTTLNRVVAIKFMLDQPNNAEKGLKYFSREIEAVKDLGHHAHIPDYYGYDSYEGRIYFVMAYVRDKSLKEMVDDGSILEVPFPQRYGYVQHLCDALQFVHRKGYIHGDVKPDNVRFDGDAAFLIDFSIGYNTVEQTTTEIGTPIYMRPNSARSIEGDIFSMALVVYEILFGRHAIYTREDIAQLNSYTVIGETYRRITGILWHLPSKLSPESLPEKWVSDELKLFDAIFKRALSLDVKQSYKSAEDFLKALSFLQERVARMKADDLPDTKPTAPTSTVLFNTSTMSEDKLPTTAAGVGNDNTNIAKNVSKRRSLIWATGLTSGMAILLLLVALSSRNSSSDAPTQTPQPETSVGVATDELTTESPQATRDVAVIQSPQPTETITPSLTQTDIPASATSTKTSTPTPTNTPVPSFSDDLRALFAIASNFTAGYDCQQFNEIYARLERLQTQNLTETEISARERLLQVDSPFLTISTFCAANDQPNVVFDLQLEGENDELVDLLRRLIGE